MHYSRHRLTASVVYVTTLTSDQWVCPACLLVSSPKTKPCQFSSVQFSYVALFSPLLSPAGVVLVVQVMALDTMM